MSNHTHDSSLLPTPEGASATGTHKTEQARSVEVKCGPLLNFQRMNDQIWYGSVLIVTSRGHNIENTTIPELSMTTGKSDLDRLEDEQERFSNSTENCDAEDEKHAVRGTMLYSDLENTFWRFTLKISMRNYEIKCQYSFPDLFFPAHGKSLPQTFFIPAISESMRIMFHSCNGFSVGTDEDAYSGACLWNDVSRVHNKSPFHVMIGGGDQIYNDGVRVKGPLKCWTDITNPHERERFIFSKKLEEACDKYYVNNYLQWFALEPFASCNGQIPQLNIWDDHDIIDGFGSYVDRFMKCSVFRGIGRVAHKYYLLFQHHLVPSLPVPNADDVQVKDTGGAKLGSEGPVINFEQCELNSISNYIIGAKPGPYLVERSLSIYTKLGARIAFLGIDARTERTRNQVNYPETYDIIFDRLRKELDEAKKTSAVNHLIILLGIPIAYPRLTWLENIFTSPLIAPIKFLNKRFGYGGSFFNHFDGNVDLLDDLDDHYTARTHKKERLFLMHQLQAIASEYSVRISILGGDVHLAAVGRFYTNPKLHVPIIKDHRYMANIISSAIVNKPPPQAVANLLAKRNKIHHLDENTDETLMKYFNGDQGTIQKSRSNLVTMPRRNWTMLTENYDTSSQRINGSDSAQKNLHSDIVFNLESVKDGHSSLHGGEVDAGTAHKAANPEEHGHGFDGSLDVSIRVEIDQHDRQGKTQAYGMTIPKLTMRDATE